MNPEVFGSLGWIVVAGAVCALVAMRVRLPSVVAYLCAGVLVGPILGLVDDPAAVDQIAQIGIVLLLFFVGLELSVAQLLKVGAVALVAGVGQVLFTAAGGFLLCRLLGLGVAESLFLAVAVTFSSTVVAVKLLTDKGDLDSWYGRIAVGVSLVQTLVVLCAMTFLDGLRGAESLDPPALLRDLGMAFGKLVLLFGLVAGAARFVLPLPFAWIAQAPGALFVWSLCWCFTVVALALVMNVSIEVGALLAGLSLARLPYSRDLQFRIKPLMNVFVAVFFVALGARIEFAQAAGLWPVVAALSTFVLVGNTLFFTVMIPRFGFSGKTAFSAGVTGAQISEFSFIFVGLGVSLGFAAPELVSVIGVVGLLTMAISSYLILSTGALYRLAVRTGLLRLLGADREGTAEIPTEPRRTGHVVVVGMNTLGRELARRLHARGERVVALDTDARKVEGLPCETVLGSTDLLDVLLEAGLPAARLLVSALRIEEANEHLAYRCRQFGVPCSIQAGDLSMLDNLLELDVAYLMLPKVDGVKLQNEFLESRGWAKP
jgi:Kef-type K+ transport system membrane component KefB